MPLTFLTWTLAFLPVLAVLVLMLGFGWGGSRAGAVSWFAALIVAAAFFGTGPELLAYAQVKAVLLSLDVLYIIWTALLLVSLGFSPVTAVVMACVGHGWAVNFGSLATSFQTLLAVTNLPGELLAADSAILLGIASYFSGALVAFLADGWKGLLRGLPAVLVLGTVMSVSQYLLVTNGIWTLGATGGAMVGLLAGLALARWPFYRRAAPQAQPAADFTSRNGKQPNSLWLAVSGYVILVLLAFGINLIPPVSTLMSSLQLNLNFPQLETANGWVTPAGTGRPIDIFGHPGAILLYASLLSYFIYKKSGSYD